jgi:phosphoserine phosphatase RsbU/P
MWGQKLNRAGSGKLTDYILRLEEENKKQRSAVGELSILNDLSQAISGSVDSKKIMQTIISRSIRAIRAGQGDITLISDKDEKIARTLVRSMITTENGSEFHLSNNILGWMQIHKKPLVINHPKEDQRFKNSKWDPDIHSILSVPLMVKSRLTGVLTVYNKHDETGFTDEDKRLLSIIAAQSAQVIENANLYEEQQELNSIRRDLELASQIQKKLLPGLQPDIDGYTICGNNLTARTVGGDFFDFIRTADNRWVICLGDVSGKGLPASLLMANSQAILRGQANYHHEPGTLLTNANRQLCFNTEQDKFVTLFLGVLNPETHRFHYSNAGHEHPYLIRSGGSIERITRGGIPLGMFPDQEYEEGFIDLKPGDSLVIFSDGITDNHNQGQESFGEERLTELIIENCDCRGLSLLQKIFDSSDRFREDEKPFDDMTAVVVTREP